MFVVVAAVIRGQTQTNNRPVETAHVRFKRKGVAADGQRAAVHDLNREPILYYSLLLVDSFLFGLCIYISLLLSRPINRLKSKIHSSSGFHPATLAGLCVSILLLL